MEEKKIKSIIESILFASGNEVKMQDLMLTFEISKEKLEDIIQKMQEDYQKEERGIEIIKLEDSYQLCTKKENYEYIYPIIDKRAKPSLSTAALETLAIISYNPRITRAEIESIRGVEAKASLYKLLEYGLVEEAGKSDLPGKPMTYKTTNEFLKMFGYSSLKELPELPKYKLDSNKQIVIDELLEENEEKTSETVQEKDEEKTSETVQEKDENI